MKQIFVIHGWEGSPQSNWFPWLKRTIEEGDPFTCVSLIQMPSPNHPILAEWLGHLAHVIENARESDSDGDIYLIGHSLGVITILRYLETLEYKKVRGAILVAGFSTSIGYREIDSFTETPVNFEKIKYSCTSFAVIDSDNDPYVPTIQGDILEKNLRATRITIKNGGHLNADDGFVECKEVYEMYRYLAGKQ